MKRFLLDILTLAMALAFVLTVGALVEGSLPTAALVCAFICLGSGICASYRASVRLEQAARLAKRRRVLALRAKRQQQATVAHTSRTAAAAACAAPALSVA